MIDGKWALQIKINHISKLSMNFFLLVSLIQKDIISVIYLVRFYEISSCLQKLFLTQFSNTYFVKQTQGNGRKLLLADLSTWSIQLLQIRKILLIYHANVFTPTITIGLFCFIVKYKNKWIRQHFLLFKWISVQNILVRNILLTFKLRRVSF